VSLILEALRKSDHERQRGAGPAFAELPIAKPRQRTPWALVAVGVLLAVNLVVAVFLLLRNPAADTPAAAAPVNARPDTAAVSSPTTTVSTPLPAAPPASANAEVRSLTAEVGDDPMPLDPYVAEAPSPPDPALVPPMPATARPPSVRSTESTPMVPAFADLPPQSTAGLPALNLDLHVYAPNPANRFIFINGRRLTEGASLPEGATVVQITPEGAVLEYRGQRFLLQQ